MVPNRGRSRAQEFKDLVDAAPREFDSETHDLPNRSSDDGEDLEDEAQTDGTREHYEEVAKSKLRRPKEVALGPQYKGSRVSREAIFEEDNEDDPFSRGFGEDSSENNEAPSSGSSDISSDGGSSKDESDALHEDGDHEDGTSNTELSGGDAMAQPRLDDQQDKAALRKAMAEEQKVAAMISQANRGDAEKGRAVKKQRATFDSFLNTRIKLQKSLIATNTLVGSSADELESQRAAVAQSVEAAETAAFNLWYALTTFRDELAFHRTGGKRKRSAFHAHTATSDLWEHMQAQEVDALPHRNAVLQKWSIKARGVSATPQRSRLNNTEHQATIIDVLEAYLQDPERLIKRARVPRSCAPLQLANRVLEDSKIYDDADLYGTLLKELLEQKSAHSIAATNIDINFNNMRRQAKTKKNVDTRASKGRKLRYTVHEKLQNFMAPEDHGRWGERQTDELFGSLFGQRLGLGEEKDGEEDDGLGDENEAGVNADEFMLFRT